MESTTPSPDSTDSGAPPPRRFGRGLWKSTLGIAGGRLMQPFFTFVLFFFSARILTTAEFGIYVFLMGMTILFQSLSSLGLGQVLAREIGQKPAEEGAAIGSVLALSLPASLISGMAFIGLSWLLKNDADVLRLAIICALSLPFSSIVQFAESVFAAHDAGSRLFRISFAEQLFRLLSSVGLLLAGFGLVGLMLGYALGRALAAVLITAVFFSRKMSPPLRIDQANLRYMTGRLAAFVPMNFLANLYFRADVIVLAWLMTDADLGIYGVAMRVASFSFIIPESAVYASMPHFSRQWADRDAAAFNHKVASFLNLLLALGYLGAAAMTVFGGTLLAPVFGSKYAASGPVLVLLAFMLPAHGLNTQLGFLFQAAHREKTALALVATATALVFASIAAGTLWAGVIGAAVGTVLSTWVMALLHLRLAHPDLVTLPRPSPALRSIAVLAAGAVLFGVVWPSDHLHFCLLAAGVALASLVLGGLGGTLSPRAIREVFA